MQPSAEQIPRWWLWPTILSLDAPAVVLAWQRMLASAASVRVGFPETFVLGASVWLAYCADRWIEGWRLDPAIIRTPRHFFHQRWRWPIAAVWVAVLALDLAESFQRLPRDELEAGFAVLLPVLAYLLSHQLVHRNHPWRAPKEVCVAVLLGAGVAVFVASQPGAHGAASAGIVAVFVALAFTNCALISVWEHEVDRSHGQTSLAIQLKGRTGPIHLLPWALGAACLAAAALNPWPAQGFACGAASALLLGLLDRVQARLGRRPARVLADLALLTPLAPLALGALG